MMKYFEVYSPFSLIPLRKLKESGSHIANGWCFPWPSTVKAMPSFQSFSDGEMRGSAVPGVIHFRRASFSSFLNKLFAFELRLSAYAVLGSEENISLSAHSDSFDSDQFQ